ncbi:maleate cis-trans isomerase family protein [Consotaella aegiceratis]|uniref:maleate cis-trans isomerase family protein n=1 Tax=Consotaella aegiceratis TaxID=3097961 RepID=UPI002F3EF4E2
MPTRAPTIVPARFDAGIAPSRRIGLVVLSSDQVGEGAFHGIAEGAGARVFTTRVMYRYVPADAPDQEDVELAAAAGQLLPEAGIDCLAFSCTSRSAEKGEQAMIDLLEAARPGVAATTPLLAARLALTQLGARRIALVSPYKRSVHEAVVAACEGAGFDISASSCFDLALGTDFARLTPAAIAEAAIAAADCGSQAVFISCTGIRAVEAIATVERVTGLPVVTSSQALAWHALRLVGVEDPAGPGRLFALV